MSDGVATVDPGPETGAGADMGVSGPTLGLGVVRSCDTGDTGD